MSDRLRDGMWVIYGGAVGILYSADVVKPQNADHASLDWVEFHGVAADGTTASVAVVPAEDVAQAPYGLIPASRRPTRELAQALGYL